MAAIGVGLLASVLIHLLLVLWGIGALPANLPSSEEAEAIPVVLVPAEPAAEPEQTPSEEPDEETDASEPSIRPEEPPPLPPLRPAEDPKPAGAPAPSDARTLGHAETQPEPELDALETLAAQVKQCWNIPVGWTDPRQISVTVRFLLNRDGTLNGSPAVVEFPASPLGKKAADEAVIAIFQCGPFALPADKYDEWKDVQLRLVP